MDLTEWDLICPPRDKPYHRSPTGYEMAEILCIIFAICQGQFFYFDPDTHNFYSLQYQ
jgi:hypothetical protein